MDKNGFSSFLLGLGVGVGVGMLFAPKSGQETRETIKNKAGEGSEYLKNKAGEGSEYLKQRGADAKQKASDLMDRSKEAFNRQRENLAGAVEAGKQAYRDATSQPGTTQ